MTAGIGDNKPPLDDKDALVDRMDRDGQDLAKRAATLALEVMKLPAAIETEEQAATVTDTAAKVATLVKDVEKFRVETGRPYLDCTKAINAWAAELSDDLEAHVDRKSETSLMARLNRWQNVLRERAAAEQREKQRLARIEEEKAAQAARDARAAALKLEQEAAAAAAKLRAAQDEEGRKAAALAMQKAQDAASAQRQTATEQEKASATAGRQADTAERVAATGAGSAARVTTGGASASQTRFWNHRIDDATALLESMGPLGAYISNDAVSAALTSIHKLLPDVKGTAAPNITIPGVTFFRDFRTGVSLAKRN